MVAAVPGGGGKIGREMGVQLIEKWLMEKYLNLSKEGVSLAGAAPRG